MCHVDRIIFEREHKEEVLEERRKLFERLEKLSRTEFQNYGFEMEQKQKHIRNNMKTEKEVYEYLAIKYGIPLPKE